MPQLDRYQRREFNSHYHDSFAHINRSDKTELVYVLGLTPSSYEEEDDEDEDRELEDTETTASVVAYRSPEDSGFESHLSINLIESPYIPTTFIQNGSAVCVFSRRPLSQIRRGITTNNSQSFNVSLGGSGIDLSLRPVTCTSGMIRAAHFMSYHTPETKRNLGELYCHIMSGRTTGFVLNQHYAVIPFQGAGSLAVTSFSGPIGFLNLYNDCWLVELDPVFAYCKDSVIEACQSSIEDEVRVNVR